MEQGLTAGKVLVRARRAAGLTQRELARRAGTSGATVAAYERGRKEPRLSTLQRLIDAAGGRLALSVAGDEPQPAELTGGDRWSLALHRAVLRRLVDEPDAVRARALRNVATMRRSGDGSARVYLDAWDRLLRGPLEPLVAALTALDHEARDLRQVTPFAGVVPPRERWDLLRAHREESGRCVATSSST